MWSVCPSLDPASTQAKEEDPGSVTGDGHGTRGDEANTPKGVKARCLGQSKERASTASAGSPLATMAVVAGDAKRVASSRTTA